MHTVVAWIFGITALLGFTAGAGGLKAMQPGHLLYWLVMAALVVCPPLETIGAPAGGTVTFLAVLIGAILTGTHLALRGVPFIGIVFPVLGIGCGVWLLAVIITSNQSQRAANLGNIGWWIALQIVAGGFLLEYTMTKT